MESHMRIGLGILSKPALLACACIHLSALAHSDDWNVAVLDQILASTPAGSTVARVGDMELLVSGLVAWRNELAGLPAPRSAFSGTAPLWTGGNVYYQFHPSVSAQNQQMFVDAAREWETFANVHFIARTSQPNYILVEEVAGLSGGQATVGMVGGQQAFKIGPNAWSRSVLCHELGHTLGMVHEHQRSDRDSFVTILTNNIASGQEANFVKLPTSQNLGAYDFLSIMHYARNTFSVNPATLNTIEPLPAYSQYLNVLGDGDPILTPSDRAGMATKYGAGPTISATVTNTMDGGPGSLRAALYYAFDHSPSTSPSAIQIMQAGCSPFVPPIISRACPAPPPSTAAPNPAIPTPTDRKSCSTARRPRPRVCSHTVCTSGEPIARPTPSSSTDLKAMAYGWTARTPPATH